MRSDRTEAHVHVHVSEHIRGDCAGEGDSEGAGAKPETLKLII